MDLVKREWLESLGVVFVLYFGIALYIVYAKNGLSVMISLPLEKTLKIQGFWKIYFMKQNYSEPFIAARTPLPRRTWTVPAFSSRLSRPALPSGCAGGARASAEYRASSPHSLLEKGNVPR